MEFTNPSLRHAVLKVGVYSAKGQCLSVVADRLLELIVREDAIVGVVVLGHSRVGLVIGV